MSSNIYQQTGTTTVTVGHESIANKSRGRDTSAPKLKFPESKRILLGGATAVILVFAAAYYFLMPVAEVATVRRGHGNLGGLRDSADRAGVLWCVFGHKMMVSFV
jgi:hypothetical protein